MNERKPSTLQEGVKNNFISVARMRRMEKMTLHKSMSLPNRPQSSPGKPTRSLSPKSKFGGSTYDLDSSSFYSRSSRSVKDTMVRAQTARQYYFPNSPRMSTSPHSAREILHRIESGRERLVKTSSESKYMLSRPLTNREKIERIETKFTKNSNSDSIVLSKSFVSASTRVQLPKIMPCQRSDDAILAQAKRRIARRLLAKESQVIALEELKQKEEERLKKKQALQRAAEDEAIHVEFQKFMLVAVHAISTMSIMMNATRMHRRESMIISSLQSKPRTAKSALHRARSGSPFSKAMTSGSAFITNPEGSEHIMGSDSFSFSHDMEDEDDDNPRLLYEEMTASYRIFLQIIVSKKWRLVLALSILQKRAAARILRATIPAIVKGPKVNNKQP